MALSFPHSTYGQQRSLNKVAAKTAALQEAKSLKTSLATVNDTKFEENVNQVSFIEMFANYIVRLFTDNLLKNRSLSFNTFERQKCEYLAIKQDFDYHLIG